jgi:hypothetical protein
MPAITRHRIHVFDPASYANSRPVLRQKFALVDYSGSNMMHTKVEKIRNRARMQR